VFEYLGLATGMAVGALVLCIALSRFRIVASTDYVHIVQHASKTVTYGKDQVGGNVYYHWPAWIPRIGVMATRLPSSVFSLNLTDYPAYDQDRVPFLLDVIGFFRIENYSTASARVSGMDDLKRQLDGILKGAMRAILASNKIEEILEGRSKFGEQFTEAVNMQLTQWGVSTVKAIEFMDIRDAEGSKVITNIMAKNTSRIERESRVAVADNRRAAEVAEIEAKQAIQVRGQEQEQVVGMRTAQREEEVGIRQQQAAQRVREQEAETAQRTMALQRVNTVREAEIARDAAVVLADQNRQVMVVGAEAEKQQQITRAEGRLESQRREADAKRLIGDAEGTAEQAILMAPVNSQIALAKEIGENQGYQTYLISLRQIEAGQAVGMEAAKALEKAGVKIIATTGTPMDGVKSVMDLMTPKGATQLGAALEAFGNTSIGEQLSSLIRRVGNGDDRPADHRGAR